MVLGKPILNRFKYVCHNKEFRSKISQNREMGKNQKFFQISKFFWDRFRVLKHTFFPNFVKKWGSYFTFHFYQFTRTLTRISKNRKIRKLKGNKLLRLSKNFSICKTEYVEVGAIFHPPPPLDRVKAFH